jgi:ferredoxin
VRLSIDPKRCCGNLECVRIAPMLFAEDKVSGLGKVLREMPPPDLESAAREAADACPAAAVALSAE